MNNSSQEMMKNGLQAMVCTITHYNGALSATVKEPDKRTISLRFYTLKSAEEF